MKRLISFFLVLALMLPGVTLASESRYSEDVEYVRNAYNRALESDSDADAVYNELYQVIHELRDALILNDAEEIGYARVKLFGWGDGLTKNQLWEKTDELLTFIVPDGKDKLSAMMQKFVTMDSVEGIIEPTVVNITVTDMAAFVNEFGLCEKATGYVLAMLNIYVWGGNAIRFTETGFEFQWEAIGAYRIDLGK